jgi:hypothetical protein
VALAVTSLALGGALVVVHHRSQAETGAARVSLDTALHRLQGARADLSLAQQRLAAARRRGDGVTRSFAAAQAALSSTQARLATDDAGLYFDGVDLGQLDSCLGAVEQALNQLAVGQMAGGLASLRSSSPSCASLDTGA